ncbi:Manganese containing catalase [compost metagenome]
MHVVAYAKALEMATGVDVSKLVPIPSLSNKAFTETHKYESKGLHTKLYTNSDNDFTAIKQIWKGPHPEDGKPLEVVEGSPKGYPIAEAPEVPEEFAPGISEEDFLAIAARLQQAAGIH